MVRAENIISKIETIKKNLSRLKKFREKDFNQLRQEPDQLAACERYLYLTLQATIDLAEMLIKKKNLGKPDTMSQCFEQLTEIGYIEIELSNSLVKMVGFRNALSHGYENINFSIFESVLKIHLRDVEQFVDIVVSCENLVLSS